MTKLPFLAPDVQAGRALLDNKGAERSTRLRNLRPFAECEVQVGHVAVGNEYLAPLTMTSSPSDRIVVCIAVASDPPLSSVIASETSPPSAIRGKKRCFCS